MKKGKNFLRDLEIGSKGEVLLIEILDKAQIKSEKNKEKKSLQHWDIHTENGIKFEVKYDLYSARSGNIAIEFFNPKIGKQSGIGATQAHFWIHVLPDNSVWLASVKNLKKFVSETKPLKTIAAGGDDNSSMHLYKKDLILGTVFVRLDETNVVQILKEVIDEKDLCLPDSNS